MKPGEPTPPTGTSTVSTDADRRWWLALLIIGLAMGFAQSRLGHALHQSTVDTDLQQTLHIIANNDGSLDPDLDRPARPGLLPGGASTAADLPDAVGRLLASGAATPDYCPGCGHAHHHHDDRGHDHAHATTHHDGDEARDQAPPAAISTGLVLILQQMGLREMAANLLWLQMDADSHRELWHRVNFYLELIPSIDPHFVEAFLLRAYVLDRYMKKHDEANRLLERGIKSNPLNDELPVQLGINFFNATRAHGEKRDFPRALAAFAAACRLPHHQPYADRFLAYTLAHLGQKDDAIAYLERVSARPDRDPRQRDFDREAIGRIMQGDLP